MNIKENNSSSGMNSNYQSSLPITPRETEVLVGIALGKSNKQIAEELHLSASTIRNHISSIYTKLGVSNRSQATAAAIYAGLLNKGDDRLMTA